jgi:hypothetical protein
MIILNNKYQIINNKSRRGSAIILAVVLTALLAIVGVLFLFSSRVDSVATSAVGDNEDLKLAVDTVVSQISQVMSSDIPHADANGVPIEEYYDYPDDWNPWLASLEPNDVNRWPHITDLYYPAGLGSFAYNFAPKIIYDHGDTAANGASADADGDGVSDSMWIQIPGKTSSKSKPIFAAIRIIDNGGMLNINTGFEFDTNSVGTSPLDINLIALAGRDGTHTYSEKQNRLSSYRCGTADANRYEPNVIWQYGSPNGTYTPFDISDELVLRYRYILNSDKWASRIENLWTWAFKGGLEDPRTDTSKLQNVPDYWFARVNNISADPCIYDYQHLATTYNMDRVINPAGSKMFNINNLASVPDINIVRNAIRDALNSNIYDANYIAVNLIDYLDIDSNVTYFVDPGTGYHYFGFETPCIYISEICQNFYKPGGSDPNTYRSYAIELFKPYWEDDEPNGWSIDTTDDATGATKSTPIVWTGSRRFHVLESRNNSAKISVEINEPNQGGIVEPNTPQLVDINFGPGTNIILYRNVNGFGRMPVDSFIVPVATGSWMDQTSGVAVSHSFERDIKSIHRCIRRVWSPLVTAPTIGHMNNYIAAGTEMIQAHPANKPFTNIGEIGQLFRTDVYGLSTGPGTTELSVRLNLADANFQNIFKYLTVMDPYPLHTSNSSETRIKGRININTAPWFVLAQLPWLSNHTPNYELARSIVAYRDKTIGPGGYDYSGRPGPYGFTNIGEIIDVNIDTTNILNRIGYYVGNGIAIPTTLMTPADSIGCVGDVFEERDVIFDRISNLVTVRSDVFTAYILVRIGADGPQKRVIAIFDRSGVSAGGKVKIVAIQNVPDPR